MPFLRGEYEGTVVYRTAVEVNLTADDWQLLTASRPCEDAAAALNKAASEGLSSGDVRQAWDTFLAAAEVWADHGAADTEPRSVFTHLVEQVYGRQ